MTKRTHPPRQSSSSQLGVADAVVLKDEDIFLLTARDGSVPLGGKHGLGLYYHDCRFLDGYELTVGGEKNEDLAREYKAIIAYVVYSQALKGAEYMNIAAQLEIHAGQELQHAITVSKQIDYLGGMPITVPQPVKTSESAQEMLCMDLENEKETIRNYRERVHQCEELEEFAMADEIRDILVEEQDHLIDLATALGEDVPKIGRTKVHKAGK